MIEHIKSALLSVMVLISVILTWQLWTFQPDYSYLKHDEYIENNPIGETRSLADVIKPELMIIHQEDESFLLFPKEPIFSEFFVKIKESSFENLRFLTNSEVKAISESPKMGIDVLFPTTIPTDIFKEIFTIDISSIELTGIDQIEVFIEQENYIAARFLSYNDQRVVQATTSLTAEQFTRDFMGDVEELPAAITYSSTMEGKSLARTIYLPKEKINVERITYTSTALSTDNFKQVLFSDPSYAKHLRQSDIQESYTDGNRMLNVLYSGNFLFYINPGYSDINDKSGKNVILSGLDFINGHSGWTDQFLLYDWNQSDVKEEVLFRLIVSNHPVFSINHQKVAELYVSRIGNQVYEYIRPLFDLDDIPIDAKYSVDLPSGKHVLKKLENAGFEKKSIENIRVGYTMTKNNSIISFYPEWYVHYNGKWEVLEFDEEDELMFIDEDDSEGDEDGLE